MARSDQYGNWRGSGLALQGRYVRKGPAWDLQRKTPRGDLTWSSLSMGARPRASKVWHRRRGAPETAGRQLVKIVSDPRGARSTTLSDQQVTCIVEKICPRGVSSSPLACYPGESRTWRRRPSDRRATASWGSDFDEALGDDLAAALHKAERSGTMLGVAGSSAQNTYEALPGQDVLHPRFERVLRRGRADQESWPQPHQDAAPARRPKHYLDRWARGGTASRRWTHKDCRRSSTAGRARLRRQNLAARRRRPRSRLGLAMAGAAAAGEGAAHWLGGL